MSDPRRKSLTKQPSLSYLEQSIKMIPGPPQPAPVTIYIGPKAADINLSKADLEISNRLKKLKQKEDDIPTEEEMASRLANLRGLPSDHYAKSSAPIYQAPDTRSNAQKSDDLLKQMISQVSLDSSTPRPEEEIEGRLAKLRGQTMKPQMEVDEVVHSGGTDFATSPDQPEPIDHDEITQLLKDAEKETLEADAALRAFLGDKEAKAMTASARGGGNSTSSSELDSGSDSEVRKRVEAKPDAAATTTEKAEVDRVVQIYTERAKRHEERKRKRKEGKLKDDDYTDSESDDISTSDGEKFSDSD